MSDWQTSLETRNKMNEALDCFMYWENHSSNPDLIPQVITKTFYTVQSFSIILRAL